MVAASLFGSTVGLRKGVGGGGGSVWARGEEGGGGEVIMSIKQSTAQ